MSWGQPGGQLNNYPTEYSRDVFKNDFNYAINKICTRTTYYYVLFCDPADIHKKARELKRELLPLIEDNELESIVKFVNDRHEEVAREISEPLSRMLRIYGNLASALLRKQKLQSRELDLM